MREIKDIRLFFALWPDENVREEISTSLKHFPSNYGRLVPRYNWHMTLHFIGNTTFAEKNCLDKQARKVSMSPFELTFDQTGFFKKPKVFWFGCSHAPTAVFDLQNNLGREISHCEYEPEARPYAPHVTVARKAVKKPELELVRRFTWRVDRFVLVESVSEPAGIRYRVIEQYPLD